MLTRADIQESVIPDFVQEQIPETCAFCGAELHIAETLDKVVCSNVCCVGNMISRINYLYKVLGIRMKKDTEDLQEIIETKGIVKVYDVFLHKGVFPELQGIKELPLSLYAKGLGILKNRCDILPKLFEGYTDFVSFYTELDEAEDKLAWLTKKVYAQEIDSEEDTVYVEILETLAELNIYREDLLYDYKGLGVTLVDKPVLNICNSNNRVMYCTRKGQYVNIVPNISEFTDYFVSDGMRGIRYEEAVKQKIAIITEREFRIKF